jgi:hypothetical protein
MFFNKEPTHPGLIQSEELCLHLHLEATLRAWNAVNPLDRRYESDPVNVPCCFANTL